MKSGSDSCHIIFFDPCRDSQDITCDGGVPSTGKKCYNAVDSARCPLMYTFDFLADPRKEIVCDISDFSLNSTLPRLLYQTIACSGECSFIHRDTWGGSTGRDWNEIGISLTSTHNAATNCVAFFLIEKSKKLLTDYC